jgi:hypothetical protein
MHSNKQALSKGNFIASSGINLYKVINLIGFVSPPIDLSGYDLLRDIGDETKINSIETYDPENR